MSAILNKIHEYIISKNPEADKDELLNAYDSSSVYVAMEIAEYAHRNQTQLNGKPYVEHCYDCLKIYRNFVGIIPEDPFCIDSDLLNECGIPFEGAQEVCMLHDVLEDTDVTMEDIETIFSELGLKTHFDVWIKYPLQQITHDKSKNYDEYMQEVLESRTASIVKMADLVSNLDLMRLPTIKELEMSRAIKYVNCFTVINCVFKFLENIIDYRKRFDEENK